MNEYSEIMKLAREVEALAEEDDEHIEEDVAGVEASARLLINDRE